MSIATELTKLRSNINIVYDSIKERGGMIPLLKTVSNLSSAIATIPQDENIYGAYIAGFIGTITDGKYERYITDLELSFDGIKTVGNEALARQFSNQSFNRLLTLNFSDLETVETGGLSSLCYQNKDVSQVSFPKLTTVKNKGLSSAFQGTSKLKSLSFPELINVGDNAFDTMLRDSTSFESISFDKLQTISTGFFKTGCYNATNLKSISFPSLKDINGSMASGDGAFSSAFYNTALTSVVFPKLENINANLAFSGAFMACKNLKKVSFPSLKTVAGCSAFESTFSGCVNLEEVEFPELTFIGESGYVTYAQFNYTFNNTKITTLSFPKLMAIMGGRFFNYSLFGGNTKITRIDFPSLFHIENDYLFDKTNTSLKEIHFAAANKEKIENTNGYGDIWGLGSGNAEIIFDL